MAGRNTYISQGVASEQNLIESLIIESLKIYGQNVFYIPRTQVAKDEILGEGGTDLIGIEGAYTGDAFGVALAYTDAEDTTYWGLNGTYSFDVASLSVGLETADADGSDEAFGWFAGLTFDEVGPGSLSLGMGTTANFTDDDDEYYVYEASYAYPVNDGMTITPGFYTKELSGDDETGIIVKTSFSF